MRYTGQQITLLSHPHDPPSVFDCIKSSLLTTVSSAPRKTVRVYSEIRNIIPDELHLFKQNDIIEDIKHTLL